MERIEFKRSPAKTAVLLLGALLFVAVGIFLAMTGETAFDRTMGWLCAAFFGLVVVAAAKNVVKSGVVFAFDLSGISDENRGVVIPWTEIEEVVVISIHGTRFLGVSLRQPEPFLARVSALQRKVAKANEAMGLGHWGFTFAGITPGIDEAIQFVQRNVPAVRAPEA